MLKKMGMNGNVSATSTCIEKQTMGHITGVSNWRMINTTYDMTNTSTMALNCSDSNDTGYMGLTTMVGIMVAAKPGIEMVANIFVGLLVDR